MLEAQGQLPNEVGKAHEDGRLNQKRPEAEKATAPEASEAKCRLRRRRVVSWA